jgi:adenine phosphoribosyltransferase
MSSELIKSMLGVHPDFPMKGIIFLDMFPILRDPVAFEQLLTTFMHHLFTSTIPASVSKKIDVVVGLDARYVLSALHEGALQVCSQLIGFLVVFSGFLLGPIIALRLGAAFVPVRKVGKLPGKLVSVSYEKEYGTVRPLSSYKRWFGGG